tara:strand:+ start:576 stop:1037 length:462 start_codon:yes stop_codon:yes gene_type:complete
MKKLTSIIVASLFLSQPLFAAGGYSSGTSSASTNTSADPFATVYQLIEAKKFTEAHKVLEVLNVPNKQADKFNLLGFTARKSGDLEKARAYYHRALEIDPKHVRALEYQGELFLQLGKLADAKQNLEKIQRICWLPCDEEKQLEEAIKLALKN